MNKNMVSAISHGTIETRDVGGEELDALTGGKLKEVSVVTRFVIRAENLQEFDDKLNQLINNSAV